MNIKALCLGIGLLTYALTAAASMLMDQSSYTIHFVNYKTQATYYSKPLTLNDANNVLAIPSVLEQPQKPIQTTTTMLANNISAVIEEKSTTSHVPALNIKKAIQQVRNTLCDAAGDADMIVWMNIDSTGKVFGVGIPGQSGVKISFHCKEYNRKFGS